MERQDIETAYTKYYPIIHRKCTRMLRDPAEAEDLAQETFLRLVRRCETLNDPEAVLAWVYRTATRLAIDRIRQRQWTSDATEGAPEPIFDPRAALRARNQLFDILSRLDARSATALMLHRVDGLTHPEIATVMQIGERTVRRLLRRAESHARNLARCAC